MFQLCIVDVLPANPCSVRDVLVAPGLLLCWDDWDSVPVLLATHQPTEAEWAAIERILS